MQHRFAAVHVFDKTLDAAGVGEILTFSGALIDHFDLHAVVQERQFAQSFRQNFVVKFDVVEGFFRREKVNLCAALFRLSDLGKRRHAVAVAKLHLIGLAVSPDAQFQPF